MAHHPDRDPETLEEWDNFLFGKYSYGLYPFCYSLADIIRDSDPRYIAAPKYIAPMLKKGRAAQFKQFRDGIKRKENLKKHIIEVFAKDLKAWGLSKEGKITEREIEYIKKVYRGVGPLFQEIDEEIDFCKRILLGKSLWRKKGHPTDTKNKVAFVFAQVIKKENGEPDWNVIKSLLMWLWKHIQKATYSCELAFGCPVYITTDTMRSAYFKFIKNPKRKSDIEHRATHYFSPRIAKYGKRIEFEKSYITMDFIDGEDIESRYPTIVFPNGKILKGMFNLKEAAAFLKLSSSFLKRMYKRGFLPYTLFGDKGKITFSRGELLECQKEIEKVSSTPSGKKLVFQKVASVIGQRHTHEPNFPEKTFLTLDQRKLDDALKQYLDLRSI